MNVRARATAVLSLVMSAMAGACHFPSLRSPTATRLPTQTEKSFVESDGHRINVDVYEPDRAGRHPAVILLHGSGGIHLINPSLVNRYAAVLAEQGIICFVVHYFDGTGNFSADDSVEAANYFHWVRELHDAVTWIRARPDVRPNQVGMMGHSLGAWLAVGAAAADPRVARVVLLGSGLEPFLVDSIKRMPPVLMFHGDKDDVVPKSDADHLAQYLRAKKVSVQYRVYPGEGHQFGDSAATDMLERAVKFLAPDLKRAPAR
ncbi:MAG TPA: dienelactone hydrolase family protein [Gemmatimonadaceae bacterium]|nr:dienelactone hydrolase family protein [Gemmatimonadaceae bacterium]